MRGLMLRQTQSDKKTREGRGNTSKIVWVNIHKQSPQLSGRGSRQSRQRKTKCMSRTVESRKEGQGDNNQRKTNVRGVTSGRGRKETERNREKQKEWEDEMDRMNNQETVKRKNLDSSFSFERNCSRCSSSCPCFFSSFLRTNDFYFTFNFLPVLTLFFFRLMRL